MSRDALRQLSAGLDVTVINAFINHAGHDVELCFCRLIESRVFPYLTLSSLKLMVSVHHSWRTRKLITAFGFKSMLVVSVFFKPGCICVNRRHPMPLLGRKNAVSFNRAINV